MAIYDNTPISLLSGADLSARKWRFGKISAGKVVACSVAGERADGIIGSGPAATDLGVDLQIERIMKVEAGGAITAGDPLATDTTGRAVTAVAGQYINGYALEAASGAGALIACIPPRAANATLAANQVNNQVGPGSPVIYTFAVPDAATGDIDIIVSDKIEVIDVVCQKQNGAGAANTMQLKNAATAISDAIACAVDNAITRAGTIDDAQSTVNAGGTLRLTATRAAGTRNALVVVHAIKRA